MADLAALLDKEASAEIEAILSEARTRASEIVAGAEQEAQALLTARERNAEAQYQAALVRARSAAQLEASSLTLRAQHAAVESVFDEVERKIDTLVKGADYGRILQGLMSEALEAGGGRPADIDAVVVSPDEKQPAVVAATALGLDGKVQTDPKLRGGVRLRSSASNVAIENTLYGRLDALREELASDVSQVLLSKEG